MSHTFRLSFYSNFPSKIRENIYEAISCRHGNLSKFWVVNQSDIKTKLKKTFSANRKNFRAEVLVDDHKPFTIRYDHKRMKVIVNCHCGCWNNFGYVGVWKSRNPEPEPEPEPEHSFQLD